MLLKISPVVLGMALRSHSLSFFIAASMKLAVARFFAAAFVFGPWAALFSLSWLHFTQCVYLAATNEAVLVANSVCVRVCRF